MMTVRTSILARRPACPIRRRRISASRRCRCRRRRPIRCSPRQSRQSRMRRRPAGSASSPRCWHRSRHRTSPAGSRARPAVDGHRWVRMGRALISGGAQCGSLYKVGADGTTKCDTVGGSRHAGVQAWGSTSPDGYGRRRRAAPRAGLELDPLGAILGRHLDGITIAIAVDPPRAKSSCPPTRACSIFDPSKDADATSEPVMRTCASIAWRLGLTARSGR